MPTVEIPKKQLYSLVGERFNEKRLQELLSALGMELESYNNDDFIIEVFPNRPDLLSSYGIARALRYFLGKEKEVKRYSVEEENKKEKEYKVYVDRSVKDVRPYTVCSIATHLELDDAKIKEIIRIQEKLHVTFGRKRKKIAIGIYPLEYIKLPIYFKAEAPEKIRFRPLEADRIMNGKEILEEHPTGKKYGHLLKGKKKYPYFVDAKGDILSMPPIINSHDTGKVKESTREVFIECSGFDLEYLKKGLNIIVCALIDMGAKIYPMKIIYDGFSIKSPNLKEEELKIEEEYIYKRIGKKIDIKEALLRMGIRYDKGIAYIPPYRADILHPIDIVEDVAIGYGYDKIDAKVPKLPTIGEEDKTIAFLNKIREVLIGAGFLEVKNFHMISEEEAARFGFEALKILNPSNKEYSVLRPSLIPSLIKVFHNNKSREFPQKIFEIGKVFPSEEYRLCVGISSKESDFTRIKQVLQLLEEQLDKKFEIEEEVKAYFIEGRAGKILDGKKEIGELGELHPSLIEAYDLEMPIALLEMRINREEIFQNSKYKNF